jgi:hypothetical protein
VRLGRWYVQRYGTAAALARFSASLRRFAESHGSTKYHETITWAYLLVIADRLAEAPADQSWDAFAAANPDLLRFPGVVGDLYRPETLQSAQARARFRMPDRLGH